MTRFSFFLFSSVSTYAHSRRIVDETTPHFVRVLQFEAHVCVAGSRFQFVTRFAVGHHATCAAQLSGSSGFILSGESGKAGSANVDTTWHWSNAAPCARKLETTLKILRGCETMRCYFVRLFAVPHSSAVLRRPGKCIPFLETFHQRSASLKNESRISLTLFCFPLTALDMQTMLRSSPP